MDNVSISEHDVLQVLLHLNEETSSGPDGLFPKVPKELAEVICFPLTEIYRKSFALGDIPTEWREAHITPLLKGGDKSQPTNYRPVSLTCVSLKVMEVIITGELQDYLSQHRLISDRQHGFRKSRSCLTNLLSAREDIEALVNAQEEVDVLYVVFSKAFDSVNHDLLLNKLEVVGVGGRLLVWLKSYLTQRRHAVKIGGKLSSWHSVVSGVPQGSVLGPCLFNIYVNELPSLLSNCVMYADDLKFWNSDPEVLQRDLDILDVWSTQNVLPLNPAKCAILRIRRRSPHQSYMLGGVELRTVDSIKDLGTMTRTNLLRDALAERFTLDSRSNRRGHSWKLLQPRHDAMRKEMVFSARVVEVFSIIIYLCYLQCIF